MRKKKKQKIHALEIWFYGMYVFLHKCMYVYCVDRLLHLPPCALQPEHTLYPSQLWLLFQSVTNKQEAI